MYISQITIYNIRSIQHVQWQIEMSQAPGWHVIIGDNGSGKSSFVRAVALALVGPTEAKALRQDWNGWLRRGESKGSINLVLDFDSSFDSFSGRGARPKKYYLTAGVAISRPRTKDGREGLASLTKANTEDDPARHLWGGKSGWFSASYGPFRRFSGGDQDYGKIFYSNPRLAPHLSVFGESVALTESLEWLRGLQFKSLEGRSAEAGLLEAIKQFVNQEGFLPHRARLSNISSTGVEFVDGNDCTIPIEELSDGYRSILSMTFELIRQMVKAYGDRHIFSADGTKIEVPGVVLIDEVDAHLHPSWQQRIGLWFREHFPLMQFIVTTHSPLVCQAANVGTIWKLPRPGSQEQGGMVTGAELDRLLYGNILDAYGTEMFGRNISRSDESKKKLQRLAELNVLEIERDLSRSEKREQEELRAMLPTSANELVATNGTR